MKNDLAAGMVQRKERRKKKYKRIAFCWMDFFIIDAMLQKNENRTNHGDAVAAAIAMDIKYIDDFRCYRKVKNTPFYQEPNLRPPFPRNTYTYTHTEANVKEKNCSLCLNHVRKLLSVQMERETLSNCRTMMMVASSKSKQLSGNNRLFRLKSSFLCVNKYTD